MLAAGTKQQILNGAAAVLIVVGVVGAFRGPDSHLNPLRYYKEFKRYLAHRPRYISTDAGTLIAHPYGLTILKEKGSKDFDVIIEPDKEKSGGVFVKRDEKAGQAERIVVSFDVSGHDDITLRTGPDGDYSYRGARSHETILLDNENLQEAYIYLPTTGRFRISGINAVACREPYPLECKNDSDLIAEVKAEAGFPGTANQLELARFLLDWGANAADYDMGKKLQKISGQAFPGSTAAEIYYQYYVPNKAGGYCGSLGTFQSKLFRAFGLDAFTINFGVLKPDITHVSVVFREAGSKKFYLMDPTFNGYFVDAESGKPLDVEEMLSLPRERVSFHDRPLDRRDYLAVLSEAPNETGKGGIHDCAPIATAGDEKSVLCRRDDVRLKDFWDGATLKAVQSVGISPDEYGFVELMKRGFFSVGNGLESDTQDDFVSMLKRHEIAVRGS